ncbi:hypothetical protein [Streptomyces luteireticuli]|uniref:Uncharacterized protein n=1 Tax=Streptomyces luteireticuli TaxID=173858 RepID=A0ABN0YX81_9ACTN
MDTYEGSARLEWWANRSTSPGGYDVRVTACATRSGWTCDAVLEGPLPEDHQEGFGGLMQIDPVFTLRFDEGGEILVNVVTAGHGGRLALTAHEPAEPVGS